MFKQLYQFNKTAGLALHLETDGQFVLDGCMLELTRQEVITTKKLSRLRSVDELKEKLAPGVPLALNISGKGILTRQIASVAPVTGENFGTVMPNAKKEDFYVQQVVNGEISYVSIIRRADADKWFDLLTAAGYSPALLSLGPFALQIIEDELNVYGEEMVFNGHVISRAKAGQWLAYRYDQAAQSAFKIKIQQETIAEELLLPYAAAFQLLLNGQIEPIAASALPFSQLLNARQGSQRFRVNTALALCGIFCLLLINFIIFSWLSTDNENLANRLSKVQQTTNNVKVSQDEVKNLETILTGLGWDKSISKSRLVDELAAVLPADVKWTSLNINPIQSANGQKGRQLLFLNRTISITGTADKVLSVNEWIARVKTKTWVKSAALDNYVFNQEQNTGLFTLTISY